MKSANNHEAALDVSPLENLHTQVLSPNPEARRLLSFLDMAAAGRFITALFPPDKWAFRYWLAGSDLYSLIARTERGRDESAAIFDRLQEQLARGLPRAETECLAGRHFTAIPIRAHGRITSLFVIGQARFQPANETGFRQLLKRLGCQTAPSQLRDAWFKSPPISRAEYQGMTELGGLLARQMEQTAAVKSSPQSAQLPPAVRLAMEYLQAHSAVPFAPEKVARHAGVCEGHLSRQFKKILGMTMGDYHLGLRLGLAARQLRETRARVADCALVSGFNSIPYFNLAFKKHFGVSPGNFRKENG